MDTDHHAHMHRALDLARQQYGRTGKNPSVGCVIVDRQGTRIGEAATGDGGHAHAEQLALHGVLPQQTAGATAYVTLEPCRARSNGASGCSERLIKAGIARVVIAIHDPHPQGRGGIKRLETAGVKVETGLMKTEIQVFYQSFLIKAARAGQTIQGENQEDMSRQLFPQ